jgi:GNAT superfamily N-acetyltransferase
MLIEPEERGNGLGEVVHEALIGWTINLGAKSFRVGVIEYNNKGINFCSTLGYKKIKRFNMTLKKKTHIVNVMDLQFCN